MSFSRTKVMLGCAALAVCAVVSAASLGVSAGVRASGVDAVTCATPPQTPRKSAPKIKTKKEKAAKPGKRKGARKGKGARKDTLAVNRSAQEQTSL